MNEPDDWLSPAAFVAGIDLEAEPLEAAYDPSFANETRIMTQAGGDGGTARMVQLGTKRVVEVSIPGYVSVEVFNMERTVSDMLRHQIAGLFAGSDSLRAEVDRFRGMLHAQEAPISTVNASHQQSYSLIVNPLIEPLDSGEIITIDDVFEWDRRGNVPKFNLLRLIVTNSLGIGGTVIHIYPGIIGPGFEYRTVIDLPMNGACIRKVPPHRAEPACKPAQ